MSSKIQVVFGVNDFLVGGMQHHFTEQLRFYDRERYDIILITLFTFPGEDTLYHALPEWLVRHRFSFRGFLDIASWIALYRLLRTLRPDVVVSSLFFSNTVFRALAPFIGYACVPREHNTYVDKSFWERLTDRILAARSYRIVAVSPTVADFTAHQERIPREKFVVIENGIDLEHLDTELRALPEKTALRRELGFSPDDFIIVNVARLVPQKNHELLIDGFARFYEKTPSARLLVVGGGPLMDALAARAREHGLADRVTFYGTQHDVAKYYKASDVFALTSHIEGFAIVCIEAMACGLPVVSTKTAGPDTYIEEGVNGFFIAPPTSEAVAAALTRVYTGRRDSLADGARATAPRFDVRAVVAQYEKLFSEAAASRV
ncbi:MAG TPA: glycosyltransferase [Candidatus Paceibacterota bacterium]|nr:glycosyltransferase [Candidatus Paceibacterota bacterium]